MTTDESNPGNISRFIPAQFLRALGKNNISELGVGDFVEKEMSLLFTDIRNFTSMSESMSAEDTIRFLNSYFLRMNPVVDHYNGFIDKFMGDAIMAIFENAEDSLKAAIEMRLELRVYNAHRKSVGYKPIQTGIGLHRGSMVLGTVGSDNRIDTTVIGDTVNLASRVETMTKIFKIPLLFTDAIYKQLNNPDNFLLRELDSVRLRGKRHPIVLYECFDIDATNIQDQKSITLSDYQTGLFLYKAGNFTEAIHYFGKCLETCKSDDVSMLYKKRCEKLIKEPPNNWTGISVVK